VISTDGRNLKNIKARIGKGKGINKKILSMLESIPFGKRYFEVGMILRESLLVSSMLFNSEAWYNLTNAELDLLETIDLAFLRQLLEAPKGTPKEMLFLELGCIPFREIIREKRLGYLHYILNEDKKSMIFRFFESQMKQRTKKDWVTTVLDDLEKLEINLSMEEIAHMKKTSFMNLIKNKINRRTFENLESLKPTHSKVKNVEHIGMQIQKYLQLNNSKMTKIEAQLIFQLRCRMTEAKVNLKGKYDNLECSACGMEEESQEHIIKCEKLNKNIETEDVDYENIFNGTVAEKLKIAKRFKENYDLLEKMKK
jgi:hypothetical protein